MVLIDGSCTKLLAMTPPPCGFQKHTLKTLLLFIHLLVAVAKKKDRLPTPKENQSLVLEQEKAEVKEEVENVSTTDRATEQEIPFSEVGTTLDLFDKGISTSHPNECAEKIPSKSHPK